MAGFERAIAIGRPSIVLGAAHELPGEAQLVFAALARLGTSDPAAGAEALCVVLEQHGEPRAAEYVGRWLSARSR